MAFCLPGSMFFDVCVISVGPCRARTGNPVFKIRAPAPKEPPDAVTFAPSDDPSPTEVPNTRSDPFESRR